MCEHKNLKTVNDELFCKDCGQQLPLDFLTNPVSEAPEKQPETEPEKEPGTEPETEPEKQPDVTAEQENTTEAQQGDQEQGQNLPDDSQTNKSAPEKKKPKTTRKTAKKGE